jgi:tetratricopeptide (TPR) repeat protein
MSSVVPYYALLIGLAGSPICTGLFFDHQKAVAGGVMGLLFLLSLAVARRGAEPFPLLQAPLDRSLLLFWLAGIAAQFGAIYARGNLLNVAFLAAGLMAYGLARSQTLGMAGVRLFLWFQVAGAIAVTFIGLAGYAGTVTVFRDALFGNRLASTFQYPNATAAYLLAHSTLSWGLLAQARTFACRSGLAAVATALLIAFLLTLSRGAFLLFPIIVLLFLAGLPPRTRAKTLTDLVVIGAAAAVTVRLLPSPGSGAVVLYLSLAGALAGGLACALVGIVTDNPGRAVIWRPALVLVLVAGLLGTAWVRTGGKISVATLMPAAMRARVTDINLKTAGAAQRLIYSRDALRIIRDYPALGVGGGGWASLHHRYQDYYYIARQTHSHYLQVAVESGLLGLAAFTGFVILLLRQAYRAWRGATLPDRVLPWTLTCAALTILLHSVIDFDLSFGQMQLLLLVMAGLVAGMTAPKARLMPRFAKAAAVLVAVTLIGFGGTVFAGYTLAERAQRQADDGRVEEAVASLVRATRFDPANPRLYYDLGRLGLQVDPEGAVTHARWAVALDPYRPEWNTLLTETLLRTGRYEEALPQAERTVALAPYRWHAYAPLANALLGLSLKKLEVAQPITEAAAAGPLADRALAVERDVLLRQEKLATVPGNLLTAYPQVSLTPELHYHLGRAHYLRGQWAEAERHLKEAAAETAWRISADRWLYATYHQTGQTAAIETLRTRPWIRLFGGTPEFRAMLDYPGWIEGGR